MEFQDDDRNDLAETREFWGSRGEPSYEELRLVAAKLQTFVEAEETSAALRLSRKEATLYIHGFLAVCRRDSQMAYLRDVIAILASRQGLTWAGKSVGPYRLLVKIVYPTAGQGLQYTVANALELIREKDEAGAAKQIDELGGVDQMYRKETRPGPAPKAAVVKSRLKLRTHTPRPKTPSRPRLGTTRPKSGPPRSKK
jgi:hypothetical protein